MKLTGWGKYPVADVQLSSPDSIERMRQQLADGRQGGVIPRGLGRSYGDSALAHSVLETRYWDHFLRFDEVSGILTCQAGVSLAAILTYFVPKGWFLPVTPGTKFVSVGGAIASDVHGKNHHVAGSFSEYIRSFDLLLASGEIVTCSKTQHPELFLATCGGMGLTGVILQASIQLQPIASAYIDETVLKADNLEHALSLFATHDEATYSVAWIDCLAKGRHFGRSLVMLGEHAATGGLTLGQGGAITIPVDLPGSLLNRFSIQAFNALYYHRVRTARIERQVHYESFFYPLDSIGQWNRMYGKRGFTQYQFVLPRDEGLAGLSAILSRIVQSRRGSFLAVLKAFGEGNANYLSFPQAGYTLALDFKLDATLLSFLEELDAIVLNYGGRLYLAKDARMSAATFKRSYAQWQTFAELRQAYGADKLFNSLQSQRLRI